MNNDADQDKRVSDTYRSLASEQAPPQLDRKVLEMAAAERKRPLYSRWISWTRPLAWAATITLCLAITLELSRDPSLSPALEQSFEALPEASLDLPAEVPKDAATPQLKKREQDQVLAETMNDEIVAEKTALGRSASKQTVQEPASARVRQPAGVTEEVVVEVAEEEKEKATDANLRAEASFSSVAMANARDDEANECAGEARTEAESWLECIDELEAAGDTEAAERQRNALKATFPDFKLP